MPIDPIIHQQLQHAVEQCGVPVAEAQITYEDYLQSEQIIIKSESLSDEQITCLLKIPRGAISPIVFFENELTAQRSYEFKQELARQDAREWLRTRNLLASLPVREQDEELGQFARRLEAYCGFEPGTVLALHDSGGFTVESAWLQRSLEAPAMERDESFMCLIMAMSASGLQTGFVGNEALEAPEN